MAEYYRVNNNHLKAFDYLAFCFDNDVFDLQTVFQILTSYFQMAIEEQKYLELVKLLLEKAPKDVKNGELFLNNEFYETDDPSKAPVTTLPVTKLYLAVKDLSPRIPYIRQ